MAEISTTTTTPLSLPLLLKVLVFLQLPTPSENLTFFIAGMTSTFAINAAMVEE